jgi:hypothetical protein
MILASSSFVVYAVHYIVIRTIYDGLFRHANPILLIGGVLALYGVYLFVRRRSQA